jgi:hypothetical protein
MHVLEFRNLWQKNVFYLEKFLRDNACGGITLSRFTDVSEKLP